MQRRPKSLEIHLKEVERYPTLSPKEEKKLALQVLMGNSIAREKLITSNMRYVLKKANEYRDQGFPIEDLIQEGYIGLCKAVDRYDPMKGFKFITFASWWIFQGIAHGLTTHAHTVRLPANKISQVRKVKTAEEKLSKLHGRAPTLEELQDELPGVKVDIIMPLVRVNFNKKNSQANQEDSNISEQDEIDILAKASGIPFPQPDDDLVSGSVLEELSKSIDKLNDREADIIRLYYGLGDLTPLTLEEIGELHDLTRERIRQIKNIALSKLAAEGALQELLA